MSFRIAFDASAAAKRDRTGVARYAVCLLEALLARYREDQFTRFILGYRLSRLRRHRFRFHPREPNARLAYFAEPFERLTLGAFDLFHGLDARIPARGAYPKVVTLHDVAPALRAEIASSGFRERKQRTYRTIARSADRIICVSRATRDAFGELFELPEERFAVIHHGLEGRFRPVSKDQFGPVLERLGVRQPYLLFVGLLSERKNCVTLIEAFDRIAAELPELQLVLAGGRAHGFERIGERLSRSRHAGRIVLPGFVADDDLPALYSGALAFVFPGENEGFGLPLLEAMACGVPVVAADTPVSREVAGDAACLLDMSDPQALAFGLAQLSNDEPRRQDLTARGQRQAGCFTWREAAERTMAVYRDVLEERA